MKFWKGLVSLLILLCALSPSAADAPSLVKTLRKEWYRMTGRDSQVKSWMMDLDPKGKDEMKRQALSVIDASLKTLPIGATHRVASLGFGRVLDEVKRELKLVHARRVKEMEQMAEGSSDERDFWEGKKEDHHHGARSKHHEKKKKVVEEDKDGGGDESSGRIVQPKKYQTKHKVVRIKPPEVLQPPTEAARKELFSETQLKALDSLTTDARHDLLEVIRKVEAETEAKSEALKDSPKSQKRIQLREGAVIHSASRALKKDVLNSLNTVRLAEDFLRTQNDAQKTSFLRSVILQTEKKLQEDKEDAITHAKEMTVDGKPLTVSKDALDDDSMGMKEKAKLIISPDTDSEPAKDDQRHSDLEAEKLLETALDRMKDFAQARTEDLVTDVADYVSRNLKALSSKERKDLTHSIVKGAVDLFHRDLSKARETVESARDKLKGSTDQYKRMFAKELVEKVQRKLKEDYAEARRQGISRIREKLKDEDDD